MRGSNYVYVGHYTDIDGNYILKVGTTNNIRRRTCEHTAAYKEKKKYQMPKDGHFVMDWYRPVSHKNSINTENRTRQAWKNEGIGKFIPKDRFNCGATPPRQVKVKIRKEWIVDLS